MPITLNCPKCHKPFRVRDESIGGRVRCPSCGAVLQVPATLAPVSHFGLDVGAPQAPESMLTGGRPLAEDVSGAEPPASGARPGEIDFNIGNTALPAPPSIRMPQQQAFQSTPDISGIPPARGGTIPVAPGNRPAPAPAPAPAPMPYQQQQHPQHQQPPAPRQPMPAPQPQQAGPTVPVNTSWAGIKLAIGLIRTAVVFLFLACISVLGHFIWLGAHPASALKVGPGLIGIVGAPLWQETLILSVGGLLTLFALCLLFGRLRCVGTPAEAHVGGLASGAAFWTLIGLIGLGFVGALYVPAIAVKLQNLQLPTYSFSRALILGIAGAIIADLLFLQYIGQIGWSVGAPELQRKVAAFYAGTVLIVAGVIIFSIFKPMGPLVADLEARVFQGFRLQAKLDAQIQHLFIWLGVLWLALISIIARYIFLLSSAKAAVRRYLNGEVTVR
ncbi:MAG: hypothetical protein R3B84_11405 [Zavarzinella sp.]